MLNQQSKSEQVAQGAQSVEPTLLPQPFLERLESSLNNISLKRNNHLDFKAMVLDHLDFISEHLEYQLSVNTIVSKERDFFIPVLPKSAIGETTTAFLAELCGVTPGAFDNLSIGFSRLKEKILGSKPLRIEIDENKITQAWIKEMLTDLRVLLPAWSIALSYHWNRSLEQSGPEVSLHFSPKPELNELQKHPFIINRNREEDNQVQDATKTALFENDIKSQDVIKFVGTIAKESAYICLGALVIPSIIRRFNDIILEEKSGNVPALKAMAVISSACLNVVGVLPTSLLLLLDGHISGQTMLAAIITNFISLSSETVRYAITQTKERG